MNYCLRLVLAVSLVTLFTGDLCFARGSQSIEKPAAASSRRISTVFP